MDTNISQDKKLTEPHLYISQVIFLINYVLALKYEMRQVYNNMNYTLRSFLTSVAILAHN